MSASLPPEDEGLDRVLLVGAFIFANLVWPDRALLAGIAVGLVFRLFSQRETRS